MEKDKNLGIYENQLHFEYVVSLNNEILAHKKVGEEWVIYFPDKTLDTLCYDLINNQKEKQLLEAKILDFYKKLNEEATEGSITEALWAGHWRREFKKHFGLTNERIATIK